MLRVDRALRGHKNHLKLNLKIIIPYIRGSQHFVTKVPPLIVFSEDHFCNYYVTSFASSFDFICNIGKFL